MLYISSGGSFFKSLILRGKETRKMLSTGTKCREAPTVLVFSRMKAYHSEERLC